MYGQFCGNINKMRLTAIGKRIIVEDTMIMKTHPIASIIIVAVIFLGHSSHHAADLGDLSPLTS